MTTIAFLGLGNMGGPMAANLVAAGHTVRGFDPVPRCRAAAAGKGATMFDSGAEAVAEADVVITSLPNGDVVKALLRRGTARRRQAGALFIDTSTISVDDAREVHAQAVNAGMAQLDAPVSGGVKGAVAGHAGVHGRRRGGRAREGPAGAGTHGGQDHSLRRFRRGPGRQSVQQHGAGRAADRGRRGVRARREARPVGAVAVRRDHRRDRQLLGGAHELSGAGPGSDVTGQQRLQAGLRHRADEQGPRAWRWTQ